jgi:hypothetical protein
MSAATFTRVSIRSTAWVEFHADQFLISVAENVGDLIRWSNEGDKAGKGYKISSVGAIDLFPQTHHTEGLLVLTRDV